jgi:glycosyltransferase involved in cell wall biosynthesis
MRVLHIIDSGGIYGAEIMLLHLMEAQVNLGIEPILASIGISGESEKPIEVQARHRGLRVESFRMRPGPNWRGALAIVHFGWCAGVHLFHTHGYKGNILFGLLPKRLRCLPVVSTVHGWTWTGGWGRIGLYEWLDGFSLRFVDRVVLVNDAMMSHPRIKRLRPSRIAIIANGIQLTSSKSEDRELRSDIMRFAQQGFSIVAVGRLSPEKGLGTLLKVVADIVRAGEDLRLIFLGQGELLPELEQQARELGIIDRVFFAGYVEYARNYLGYFDLFCMPSLTEGLPMALLEAMAAGIPIIASRVGGIPEVLDQGRAGILVEPASFESLKGAILKVVRQPQAIQKLVEEAQRRVDRMYSSSAMAEGYFTLYQQVHDTGNCNRNA